MSDKYCEKHNHKMVKYEIPAHGWDYYCPDCDREWYEEHDKKKRESSNKGGLRND